MAAIKKSVRLVDNTVSECRIISMVSKTQGNDAVNWSGSLNGMANEYSLIMAESKPMLTETEWQVLYCIYNGYMPSEDAQKEARLLHWHISEAFQYDPQVRELLGSKQHARAFIENVNGWTITMQLSAIYHAKKFWADS